MKVKTKANKSCFEIDFKCFIFSDAVEDIEKFFISDNPSVQCKILDLTTEVRFLRQALFDEHKVRASRIDFLDNNQVFIIAENYKKLTNLPVQEINKEKDIIENLRKTLLLLGVETVTRLSCELPRMQNKTNAKFRNGTRHLNLLKKLLFNKDSEK